MTFIKYDTIDNCYAQLDGSITAAQTSINFKNGNNIPSDGSSYKYILTIIQYNVDGSINKTEKVLLTAKSGSVLTVTRGYGGSTGTTFNDGDFIYITINKTIIEDLNDEVERLESNKANLSGGNTFDGVNTFSSNAIFNGNVGIGTSSPGSKLQIHNSATNIGLGLFIDNLSNERGFACFTSNTTSYSVDIRQNNSLNTVGALNIQNEGTGTGLFIDQNGNGKGLFIDSEATIEPTLLLYNNQNDGQFMARIMRSGVTSTAFGVSRQDAVNQNCTINIGDYQLWIDSTGVLRIKSGQPTSDTDGTIVGTQS